jgi:hypothetical protein
MNRMIVSARSFAAYEGPRFDYDYCASSSAGLLSNPTLIRNYAQVSVAPFDYIARLSSNIAEIMKRQFEFESAHALHGSVKPSGVSLQLLDAAAYLRTFTGKLSVMNVNPNMARKLRKHWF